MHTFPMIYQNRYNNRIILCYIKQTNNQEREREIKKKRKKERVKYGSVDVSMDKEVNLPKTWSTIGP